ncbi:MAG: hypothetical protein K6E10_03140, partial [Eubacterium sp.]|nr:hypothetical protein [Eubacterium sp.]
LIVSSVQTITVQLFASMTASIGNYVATNDSKEVKKIFDIYSFAIFLVYGFCSVCLFNLSNRFILLLWGKNYLIDEITLFVIIINFFMYGFQTAINVFRDTTGLFVQGKYRAIFSAFVNVLFSILLVKPLGLCGVILATVISRVFVSAWYDPYILYKNFFKSSVKNYYYKFLVYFCWFLIVALVAKKITDFIDVSVLGFVLCVFITVLIGFVLVVPFLWTGEWRGLFSYFKSFIQRRKKQ